MGGLGLWVDLGAVGSDVLTARHIGQINHEHTAHIKTKKACYIEKKKKTTGTVLLKKNLPNKHYPYSFQKKMKKKKKEIKM